MQRFDYMGQKQAAKSNQPSQPKTADIISQPVKTGEQAAKEKLDNAKQEAQNEVDSVLYQDARGGRKAVTVTSTGPSGGASSGTAPSSQAKPVQPPVKKPEPVVEKLSPVVHEKTVTPPKKTRYNDAIVEDFEKNFDKTDDSGAVEMPPEQVVVGAANDPILPPMPTPTVPVEPVSVSESEPETKFVEQKYVSSRKKKEEKRKSKAFSVLQQEARDKVFEEYKAEQERIAKGDKSDISSAGLKTGVPSYLISPLKTLFGVKRQQDVVTILCLWFLGGDDGLDFLQGISQESKDFVKTAMPSIDDDIDSSDREDILSGIADLKAANKSLAHKLAVIELGMTYGLFDNMGFRKEVQQTPGTINFQELGVSALMKRLEETTTMLQSQERARNNRTFD